MADIEKERDWDKEMAEVDRLLKKLPAADPTLGRPSGGEPTVHPDVIEVIQQATQRNVTRVVLNTNGVRIAKDDRFVSALEKLRGRLEIYMQFDGFSLETHLYHRGKDLRDIKAEALRRLASARIFTTLVMAVAQGVNDSEVGRVVEYAFDTDYVAVADFDSGASEPAPSLVQADFPSEPVSQPAEMQPAAYAQPGPVESAPAPTAEETTQEAERAAARRRSTVREKVSFVTSAPAEPAPSVSHSAPEPVESPEPAPAEPAAPAASDDGAPRKAGWWSRRFGSGE